MSSNNFVIFTSLLEGEKMRVGTVKWFHRSQGYGFISPSDGKDDVFVFYPSIETDGVQTLTHGQSVSFESAESADGMRATRVVIN